MQKNVKKDLVCEEKLPTVEQTFVTYNKKNFKM